jgi:hypothetical protein
VLDAQVFQEGIEEIANTYVNRRFTVVDNQGQWKQWYKLLKALNNNAFSEAVSEWCSTKSSIPSPADILEIAGRMRNASNDVEIPKNTEHCSICQDTGLVSGHYTHQVLKRKYEYVACCICEAGQYCHSIYELPQISKDKLAYVEKKDGERRERNLQEEIKQMTKQMTLPV